ncbi:MAG: hypothetical protein GY821_07455, partial [Gammaproteobacteria bacterium]|nr:hypothetical protein [Gammaproteobacteria bacterium]
MVSYGITTACPECGVDLKKVPGKKMEAENERLRKEVEALKATKEKLDKEAALSLKEKER